MNSLFRLKTGISHFVSAGNAHTIHSPFVFSLYNFIIKNPYPYYCFSKIEKVRKELLKNKTSLTVNDLGAGSSVFSSPERRICDIARYSLQSPTTAQIFFRLCVFTQPRNILELGTSLGITTSYLASHNNKASITSFEGCNAISKVAEGNFKALGLKNIQLIEGDINQTLRCNIKHLGIIDLAVFDANHTYKHTLEYYNICKEKFNNSSVLIFDDIYWSSEMKKAWEEIISFPEVTVSMDFYDFGIVFFRSRAPKQHFILRK